MANPLRVLPAAFIVCLIAFILFGGAVACAFWQQNSFSKENRARIAENAKTAHALCDAAAGARDFWIKVRLSTEALLRDPNLSSIERESNVHFVKALNDVILAADGIARRCDGT